MSNTKPDCSRHKKEVAGITDMKVLARMVSSLHYESLAEFLNALAVDFQNDSISDQEGGRIELSKCLLWMHYGVWKASYGAERAWKHSKPYMQ